MKEVHTFSEKDWGDMAPGAAASIPRPPELNWDLWLGVAAERPFINGTIIPATGAKRRDFGTGTLGDMGCHMFSRGSAGWS